MKPGEAGLKDAGDFDALSAYVDTLPTKPGTANAAAPVRGASAGSALDSYLDDLESQPAPPAPPASAGVLRTMADMGIKAAQGAVDLGQSVVGVGSLATGGLAGKAMRAVGYDPERTNRALGEYLSPQQQQSEQNVNDAKGFVDTLVAAAKNPRAVAGSVVESLPSMFGIGGITNAVARRIALKAAAPFGGIATEAGAKAAQEAIDAATNTLTWTSGAAEGAQSAGQIADQAQGAGRDYADYAAPALASGVLTGAITRGAGKLMGNTETALFSGSKTAGVQGSLPARVAKGFISEGALQEMPQSAEEQVMTNLAMGKDDAFDGVGNQAAMGLVTGGVMGMGEGAVSPHQAADHVRATEKVPEVGVLSAAANVGTEAKAQTIENSPPVQPAQPEVQPIDPVMEQIKSLPDGPRQEALHAYNIINRPDVPKGVRQYNSKLLDKHLALLEPAAEGAAPNTPPADLLGGQPADPLQGALRQQQDEATSRQNLANWMERAQPMPLQRAQDIVATADERGLKMEVVPHAAGEGYTVIPQAWIAPSMRGQTGTALTADTAPTGVLRADATGNVAPETGAQRINTAAAKQAIDTEVQRKAELGLTPDVEAVVKSRNEAASDLSRVGPSASAVGERPGVQTVAAGSQSSDGQRVASDAADAGATASQRGRSSAGEAADGGRLLAKPAETVVAPASPVAGDILTKAGKPFATRLPAVNAAKRAGAGHDVIPVDGGFVVRKTPEWQAFPESAGSLGVARADMPQIKSEHHGAFVNFVNARGITHETVEADPRTLKPTQAEYSISKAEGMAGMKESDRSVLVSADGYVLDGHHQWLGAGGSGAPVKAIRLNAPIKDLLPLAKEFPSAQTAEEQAQATEHAAPAEVPAGDGKAAEVQPGADGAGGEDRTAKQPDAALTEGVKTKESEAEVPVNETDKEKPHAAEKQSHEAGVQPERGNGNEGGKAAKASGGDRVQRAAENGQADRGAVGGEGDQREAVAAKPDDDQQAMFSRRADKPVDLPPVVIGGTLASATTHEDYLAAKKGGAAAAVKLAQGLVNDDMVAKVKAMIGENKPIVVPVVAEEAGGRNKIPAAVAEVLAAKLGLDANEGIVQSNRPRRSAMDGLDRIFATPEFDGEVKKGEKYLLVDDTLTQGGTFAALASHIRQSGGEVVGAVALTGKGYSATITPTPETLKALREKHGDLEDQFRAATGYGFDALTESEARLLANFKPAHTVRARIAEEGRRAGQGDDAQASVGGEQHAESLTPLEIQNAVSELTGSWLRKPDIHVLDSMEDAPGPVRAQWQASQGGQGQIDGFHYRGGVYLVADALESQQDVARVLFHEALGHFGLRNVFGDALTPILSQIAALRAGEVRVKAEQYGLDMSKPGDRLKAAEEVLAEMAQTRPEIGYVKRAIAAIRTFLREHVPGFKDLALTDDEIIRNYLLPARGFVERGAQALPSFATKEGAQFSRVADPRDATTFADRARDAFHDIATTQKTFNWWNNTVGTQYQKATQDQHFKRAFDATQNYILDVSRLANDAADRARDLLPRLESLKDVLKDIPGIDKNATTKADVQALTKPVFQGTLSDQRAYKTEELKRLFNLTDKQVDLYKQFRASVDKSLDDLTTSTAAKLLRNAGIVEGMIQDELEQGDHKALAEFAAKAAEQDPKMKGLADQVKEISDRAERLKAEGYAPLMRFGQYAVSVRDPNTHALLEFHLFENNREANAAARTLASKGNVEQSVMSKEDYKLLKGVSPESLELFGDILEKAGMFDTRDELYQTYLRKAIDQRSAMKRMIERVGYPGYSADVRRVLATFVTSNARLAAKNLHYSNMLEAVENIPREKGDVRDEAVKLVKYVQEPVEEAPKIRGLLFSQFIGGSVASAVVNTTQTLTMTYPYLSQFSNPGKAAKTVLSAMKQAMGAVKGELGDDLAKAEQLGIVSPQEIHNLNAESMKTFGSHPAVQKAMFLWGSLFSLAEQFNRRVAFISAWNTAKEIGEKDPFQFAVKAVEETQGIYNKGNRPDWARGAIGATLFTFKQFSVQYLEFLTRLPAREKALALAILMLSAGAEGMPFADDIDDVIDTIAERMGYNFNSKQQKRRFIGAMIGDGASDFLLRGISTIPGMPIDVAGRMGMANLIPGTGMLRKDVKDHMQDVMEFAGPLGSAVQGATKGDFLPTSIKNLVKAADMFQTGQYRDSKGRKVIDTDATDATWKAIGFQPADVAKNTLSDRLVQQNITMVKQTEADLADEMANARLEGDAEKYQAARDKLRQWNDNNPDSRITITAAQLASRLREMRMTRDQRIIKSAPRSMRSEARAELQ
jgi:hypothetical protein